MVEMRPTLIQPRPAHAQRVYHGPLIDVWAWEQDLGNGNVARFEQVARPDTVLVLPITDEGVVYLAREQQPGMASRLHAIGGRVDPGETPRSAALRELAEETGFKASSIKLWVAWQPQSKLDWVVYIFWAGELLPGDKCAQVGEEISLVPVSVEDLTSGLLVDQLNDHELCYQLGLAAMSPHARARMETSLQSVVRGEGGS